MAVEFKYKDENWGECVVMHPKENLTVYEVVEEVVIPILIAMGYDEQIVMSIGFAEEE